MIYNQEYETNYKSSIVQLISSQSIKAFTLTLRFDPLFNRLTGATCLTYSHEIIKPNLTLENEGVDDGGPISS